MTVWGPWRQNPSTTARWRLAFVKQDVCLFTRWDGKATQQNYNEKKKNAREFHFQRRFSRLSLSPSL